jgi:cell wall-associated NlpC family hydrolase
MKVNAQELPTYSIPPADELSAFLPIVRGLDFDDPRPQIQDKGPIAHNSAEEEDVLLIAEALDWLGTPYMVGGFSRSGVDCSGFLYKILRTAMPELAPFPRKSEDYARFGAETAAIEPGDILLFAEDEAIYHVGLALSATTFIHAASEGARTGVIISSLDEGNWRARLYGARRIRP